MTVPIGNALMPVMTVPVDTLVVIVGPLLSSLEPENIISETGPVLGIDIYRVVGAIGPFGHGAFEVLDGGVVESVVDEEFDVDDESGVDAVDDASLYGWRLVFAVGAAQVEHEVSEHG